MFRKRKPAPINNVAPSHDRAVAAAIYATANTTRHLKKSVWVGLLDQSGREITGAGYRRCELNLVNRGRSAHRLLFSAAADWNQRLKFAAIYLSEEALEPVGDGELNIHPLLRGSDQLVIEPGSMTFSGVVEKQWLR